MTVVAWDGKTLAADKRAVNNGLARTVTKIRKIGPLLVGVAGDCTCGLEMFKWIEHGRDPAKFPAKQLDKEEWATVLVIEGGQVRVYERSPEPMTFEGEHFACGSGRDFAIAAMHLGKSAAEAVAVACLFETSCGNGVDEIS